MTLYPYDRYDPFSHPHTYQYTPYNGREFMNDYLAGRMEMFNYFVEIIHNSPDDTVEEVDGISPKKIEAIMGRFLEKNTGNYVANNMDIHWDPVQKYISKIESTKELPTKDFMLEILPVLYFEKKAVLNQPKLLNMCKLLLKKFEIRRLLSSCYSGDGFRKRSDDCQDMMTYVLAGCFFAIAEKITGKLSFLNALLKVNDIISALVRNDILKKPEFIIYALCSIGYEIDMIETLAKGGNYTYE